MVTSAPKRPEVTSTVSVTSWTESNVIATEYAPFEAVKSCPESVSWAPGFTSVKGLPINRTKTIRLPRAGTEFLGSRPAGGII